MLTQILQKGDFSIDERAARVSYAHLNSFSAAYVASEWDTTSYYDIHGQIVYLSYWDTEAFAKLYYPGMTESATSIDALLAECSSTQISSTQISSQISSNAIIDPFSSKAVISSKAMDPSEIERVQSEKETAETSLATPVRMQIGRDLPR